MSIVQPLLLHLAVPCGLVYIVVRTSRHILDVIALTLVLRGTTPAERPAILREFGPWLARDSVHQVALRGSPQEVPLPQEDLIGTSER